METELLFAEGFEDAFVGTGERCGQPIVAVYDRKKCIEVLQKRDGMTQEEAIEFFDFNVVGAWVGPQTPMFIDFEGIN